MMLARLDALERQGLFVPSELKSSIGEGLDPDLVGEWVVRQPELPLVTYSYEWSFSMLRDAALTTLAALEVSLAHGFLLKDATSFNVLFEGKSIGMTNWLLLIWSCVALDLAALAWLGWRKPKAAT